MSTTTSAIGTLISPSVPGASISRKCFLGSPAMTAVSSSRRAPCPKAPFRETPCRAFSLRSDSVMLAAARAFQLAVAETSLGPAAVLAGEEALTGLISERRLSGRRPSRRRCLRRHRPIRLPLVGGRSISLLLQWRICRGRSLRLRLPVCSGDKEHYPAEVDHQIHSADYFPEEGYQTDRQGDQDAGIEVQRHRKVIEGEMQHDACIRPRRRNRYPNARPAIHAGMIFQASQETMWA